MGRLSALARLKSASVFAAQRPYQGMPTYALHWNWKARTAARRSQRLVVKAHHAGRQTGLQGQRCGTRAATRNRAVQVSLLRIAFIAGPTHDTSTKYKKPELPPRPFTLFVISQCARTASSSKATMLVILIMGLTSEPVVMEIAFMRLGNKQHVAILHMRCSTPLLPPSSATPHPCRHSGNFDPATWRKT